MLDSSTHLLKTARSLVINPKDPPTWSVLAGHSRTVSDSIKSLITAIRLDNNDSGVFMQRFKEHFDILGDRYIHFVADG